MLQAKQLGKELFVGVHSDEDIAFNKGPVVMHLDERVLAVEACKWSNHVVSSSPYVTDPQVMDDYGCQYVVHGDDITTDASGEDCYKAVKDMGRFLVVKRTQGISTTDLVGRMLLFTKSHHIASLKELPESSEGSSSVEGKAILSDGKSSLSNEPIHALYSAEVLSQFKSYATCYDGLTPGSIVAFATAKNLQTVIQPSPQTSALLANGIYYTDGGFDLFNPGHIEALRLIHLRARAAGCAVVAGVHDDRAVNLNKGINYPIMNVVERALCVLQCAYVDGIVVGAPSAPTKEYLGLLSAVGSVKKIFHGPTSEAIQVGKQFVDPYHDVRDLGLNEKLGEHRYSDISTEAIVERVLVNRLAYEERQKKKGWKGEVERKLLEAEKRN
ncbi:hypothetical protein BABINDRAFT_163362 [Babjeviella inositovora NRRL Y-12698]|uniref:ethanolamine-phosphate cytidylyltransferase n=1 Tax=Babjeviella inositovora NRRL Y-12698 TaxID=984486 RepID=A0A1E3QIX0_9ASCO|nr:uncharacterized protein BABINDRAFT_163362 [Babjeviella inositovora NRRL Y-12698]ODQ77645.1 hypothetical protein BABINDRAFT_163362 [Babjeviella inositovora NRRL Y-12698]